MTRYKRAPLGSAILGGLFRDHWYLVPHPSSLTPQNRMSRPPPSPYHWARLASAGSAKPGGGGRSVCNWEFTHVTHMVKLFMQVKYKSLYIFRALYITNKTYFRNCAIISYFSSAAN